MPGYVMVSHGCYPVDYWFFIYVMPMANGKWYACRETLGLN